MKMQPYFHRLEEPVRLAGKISVFPQEGALRRLSISWNQGTYRGHFTPWRHCLPLSRQATHGWGLSADPPLSLGFLSRHNRSACKIALGVLDDAFCDVGTACPMYHCWGMLMHLFSRSGLGRPIQEIRCFWIDYFSHPQERLIALEIYFKNKISATMSELRATE